MRLGNTLTIGLLGLALALGTIAPAQAEEPAPSTLTLAAEPAFANTATPLQVDLVREDGSPVAAAQVLVERRVDDVWSEVELVITDEQGHAALDVTLRKDRSDNLFRASYAGDATTAPASSGQVQAPVKRRQSKLHLGGPDHVVDEQKVTIKVRWRTGNGEPVSGVVRLMRRNGKHDWRKAGKVRTGEDGRAVLTVRPRVDTRWRGKVRRLDWVTADRSSVHAINNLPPGEPVRLPRAAPKPRVKVPAQAHAVGKGAHPVVTKVPNWVWRQMTGRTWHRGCPVGRGGLRYLKVNYWDYRGYRRRGELVANADAVHQMAGAFVDMYNGRLPIRAMYRVDRFGYSKRVRGGNDYRSMAAGNTSAFNCRDVVGKPGTRSPHAYGRSLDVNTWENPYRSRQGTVPNTWWMGHSHKRVAWRSSGHRVVKIMARHGLRWTYGNGDTQHFDARPGNGRISTDAAFDFEDCAGVCD